MPIDILDKFDNGRPTMVIMGGAFDPPHLMHLTMPFTLIARLPGPRDLHRVVFVPCGDNAPHKQGMSDAKYRSTMLNMSIHDLQMRDKCDIDFCEADDPYPHYTYQTVIHLKDDYPNYNLALLMGSDEAEIFQSTWKYSDIICEYAEPVMLTRPGYTVGEWPFSLCHLGSTISSSEIRRIIRENSLKTFVNLNVLHLTPSTYQYILEKGLYQDAELSGAFA